jgi:hypothetical protein
MKNDRHTRRYFRSVSVLKATILTFFVAMSLTFVAIYPYSTQAGGTTRTWDGGGSTNNWSEAANWSGDTLPGTSDSVVFNGTSTKNATIDVSINVSGIQINSGYTGTITQAGSSTVTVGTAGFFQSSGTFTGGGGDIDINGNFALSAGTFTASSGTTFFGAQFASDQPGGTFNHNGGTVVFDGISVDSRAGVTVTLNNLIVNKPNNNFFTLGGLIIVNGTLTLTNGVFLAGTIETRGPVVIDPTFGGGGGSLNITGTSTRTITLAAGVNLLNVTLNAPNVTIQTSGSGTLNWQALTLQAGTINQGAVNFVMGNVYDQGGGTFNCSSNPITFNNHLFETNGTFVGGSGNIDINGNFALSGGIFTASSGTTSFGAQFASDLPGGTFNHNGGTVVFDGVSVDSRAGVPVTLNNLTVNKPNNNFFTLGGLIIVNGTLTLTDGVFLAGTLEARGPVVVDPTFDGGGGALNFAGSANQTFANNGGANLTGTWTINKPFGVVTATTSVVLQSTQAVNIVSGGLHLGTGSNSFVSGALTINANGKFLADAAQTVMLGGDVSNSGLINLHANGSACPTTDSILLRSTVDGTQRSWSGSGVFRAINVDVKDMGGSAAVKVFNGTNSGNNGGNWTFDSSCLANFIHTPFDFDGDRKTDFSIFRPSSGVWFLQRSTLGIGGAQWGLATDKNSPADFDGDGITDVAVWREATRSNFFILQSSSDTVRIEDFGVTGDDPAIVGDWDGDGKADPAVYRNGGVGSQSFIFFRGSLNNPNGNITFVPWGLGGDVPVRGDFDGDGKMDAAVFRSSDLNWYILKSSNLQLQVQQWGFATDKRIEGDFDGDGKTDFAVFRPSDTFWYILQSSNGQADIRHWGLTGDIPLQGDYDGDGKSDLAIWRETDHNFWVLQSGGGVRIFNFGLTGDTPIASAFLR